MSSLIHTSLFLRSENLSFFIGIIMLVSSLFLFYPSYCLIDIHPAEWLHTCSMGTHFDEFGCISLWIWVRFRYMLWCIPITFFPRCILKYGGNNILHCFKSFSLSLICLSVCIAHSNYILSHKRVMELH